LTQIMFTFVTNKFVLLFPDVKSRHALKNISVAGKSWSCRIYETGMPNSLVCLIQNKIFSLSRNHEFLKK